MQDDISKIFPEDIIQNFVASWISKQTSPITCEFPSKIPEKVISVCKQHGIKTLYKHQFDSINSILHKNNVLISTGTASGKSLCYQIPILTSLIYDKQSTALLLYPTKALSSDQFKSFSDLLNTFKENSNTESSSPTVGIYDGDTKPQLRTAIRNSSNLIISNPDMLHIGILPHHPSWERLFVNLKYIVIDEAHTYSGVFGAHFTNVIRRLKRIAAYYGSAPQFILSSATIGNPKQFAEHLIEENVVLFNNDYSQHAKRTFLFYNPPVVDQKLGIRKSMMEESRNVARYLLENGLQSIMFSRSRLSVENMFRRLIEHFGQNNYSFAPYRSGYTKSERRSIEAGLKNGDIDLVVSTIALELGIDMGSVDAIILNGYPGSISRFIQQAGRAGRQDRPALCIFIASSSPLDQYIIHHSEFIKDKMPEKIYTDPNNPFILFHHLRCASFELGFSRDDSFGKLPFSDIKEYFDVLESENILFLDKKKYFWVSENYPASDISLRSIIGFAFQLFDKKEKESNHIGDIDRQSVKKFAYPGAIYLNQGIPYIVTKLDQDNRKVDLKLLNDSEYYTEPSIHIDASIEQILLEEKSQICTKRFGDVKVVEHVKGFKRILWDSNEVISIADLDLSPDILETKGMWISFSEEIIRYLQSKDLWGNNKNYYGSNWGLIRGQILLRDKFTCQLCGSSPNRKDLHVHHMMPFRTFHHPSKANMPENLITLCRKCHAIAEQNLRIRSTLNGLGFAIENVAPVFIKCSMQDIGYSIIEIIENESSYPGILIYDQYSGGIDLAINIYQNLSIIFDAIKELVFNCPCLDGCPSCVGPGGENGQGAKQGVSELLKRITD